MAEIPTDLRYSTDHLWVRASDTTMRIGVTDYAQEALGDVIAVTLPAPGDTISAGAAFGDIESVKSVSDLMAPMTGVVRACNDDLASAAEQVNSDPYGNGWIIEAEIDPSTVDQQLTDLMDADAYRQLIGA